MAFDDLTSLPSRVYIEQTEESRKADAAEKERQIAKKVTDREAGRMGGKQLKISDPIGENRAAGTSTHIADNSRMPESRRMGTDDPRGLGRARAGAGQEDTAERPPPTVEKPKTEAEKTAALIKETVLSVATELAKTFSTKAQVQAMVRTGLPRAFDGLGNLIGTGTYLRLGPSGAAMWAQGEEGIGTGGMDYDYIYIGGIEYTPGANTNNYDFIQIGADGSSSWIPAMISPMPTGYEIFNVKKNHIHITGATAGNI